MTLSRSFESFKLSPHKSIKHSTYFDVYDNLFSKYIGNNITFVEVGVLGGGSLFMWRKFFGPKARIIGIDLNPGAKRWEKEGFEIYIGNQADQSFWTDFFNKVGPIDILLDDGGHTYDQQIVTTECVLDNINEEGMLVVEDTHTSYMKGFGPKKYSYLNYTKSLIDKLNFRFHSIIDKKSDSRFWSIQIFDSFVVYHVSRSKAKIISSPIDNGKPSPLITDYRQVDNVGIGLLESVAQKASFLRGIPILTKLKRRMTLWLADRNFKSRKYFKK